MTLLADTDLSGLAQVIYAVTGLITVVASVFAAVHARWANAKAAAVERKVDVVTGDVHKIELATNSMKDQLVAATQLAGEAKGRDQERAAAKGANP